jgi:invasion protein IalB
MFLNVMSSVYTKITTINFFFLVFFLIYFLYNPIFSQNNDNSNILNSNEEIKAEYGNWLQICENEKNQCVGVQFALDVQGERAARFIIERINQNTETVADSLITIFVPYEANVPILPNGITLAVDSAEPFTEQFLFCDQLGCTSQFGLTKQGIELFMTGANLAIYMVDIRNPNNKFVVDVDLENFDKIYESITPL